MTKQPGAVWRPAGGDRLTLGDFIPSVFPVQALVSLFIIVNIVLHSNECISTSVPESTTGGGGAVSHDRCMTNVFESVANDD